MGGQVNAKSINIIIRTPDKEENDPEVEDKQNELRAMQFFLKHPQDDKFTIRFEDKNDKREDFKMAVSKPESK